MYLNSEPKMVDSINTYNFSFFFHTAAQDALAIFYTNGVILDQTTASIRISVLNSFPDHFSDPHITRSGDFRYHDLLVPGNIGERLEGLGSEAEEWTSDASRVTRHPSGRHGKSCQHDAALMRSARYVIHLYSGGSPLRLM
jgi:hypothetical protein